LGPASTFGKDLMPRTAALLGVGQISDVVAVEGPYRFRRPMYAGNVIVTVEAVADRPVVATVRGASYRPAGRHTKDDRADRCLLARRRAGPDPYARRRRLESRVASTASRHRAPSRRRGPRRRER